MTKVTWRLVPDDPDMPKLESNMLPVHGGKSIPILIRAVTIAADVVTIDYALA
jgi:hypothetical protein